MPALFSTLSHAGSSYIGSRFTAVVQVTFALTFLRQPFSARHLPLPGGNLRTEHVDRPTSVVRALETRRVNRNDGDPSQT